MLRSLFNRGRVHQDEHVATMSVEELHHTLGRPEPLLVLDVRSPEEYAYDGHIVGSRLLPLPMLALRIDELPRDRPIVCVCRSGHRSQVACELLSRQGFAQTINLSGGMIAWRQAGLPLRAN
jgi:rhodanese-related sulfurtransferase